MSAPRTLLVTGGGGFVMCHVARRWLVEHPRDRAIVVDAQPLDEPARRFLAPIDERLHFIEGDVTERALWSALDAEHRVDYAVHGAAVTSINRQVHADGPGRPGLAGARAAFEANVLGTFDALAWASRHAALRRFVYVGSGSVYADTGPDPLPEDGYVAPRDLYPISKQTGELLTACAVDTLGLDALAVRLSGVFGPLDRVTASREVRSAPRAIAECALGARPVRVRSLEGSGDFVHAADVAGAVLALLEAPAPRHRVYNVAAGSLATVADVVAAVKARIPSLTCEIVEEGEVDVDLPPGARPGRFGAYDVSRLREETGWSPRPLGESLGEYVDWMRAQEN